MADHVPRRSRLAGLEAAQALGYLADEVDDMEQGMIRRFDQIDARLAALDANQTEGFKKAQDRSLVLMGGLAVSCVMLAINIAVIAAGG